MSLNRYEQHLHDYIESNPEEKRYWTGIVIGTASQRGRKEETVLELNALLWDYFQERAMYESPFKDIVATEGTAKISMLNLAEYLLRMWGSLPATKVKH